VAPATDGSRWVGGGQRRGVSGRAGAVHRDAGAWHVGHA